MCECYAPPHFYKAPCEWRLVRSAPWYRLWWRDKGWKKTQPTLSCPPCLTIHIMNHNKWCLYTYMSAHMFQRMGRKLLTVDHMNCFRHLRPFLTVVVCDEIERSLRHSCTYSALIITCRPMDYNTATLAIVRHCYFICLSVRMWKASFTSDGGARLK